MGKKEKEKRNISPAGVHMGSAWWGESNLGGAEIIPQFGRC